MKNAAKSIISSILAWQVRRLLRRSEFKVVAVAGSIGKTSTKLAIARLLSGKFKVQYQKGNYNHYITVPLIFFGLEEPSLFNPFAWAKTLLQAEMKLHKEYPYDVVVIELGTDQPGDIRKFKSYLRVDAGVLSAITPEHMEFFDDLDDVAKEEISLSEFSDLIIANADLCGNKYLKEINKLITYGTKNSSDYRITGLKQKSSGFDFEIQRGGEDFISGTYQAIALSQLYSVTAAAVVGELMGMDKSEIKNGIKKIEPVNGRLNLLKGIKGTTIIDDTYNASPEATRAALEALYNMEAPSKIALLGNMNELGKFSKDAHKDIGAFCDPKKLDLVVTLGPDSNKYIASEAEKKGCVVIKSKNAIDAARKINDNLKNGALILAKGSQNGVFAEEAVKKLLASREDRDLLVRQSPAWITKKEKLMKLDLS